ncbi:MAG: MarR family transcriptional regulator [Rhodobacteraceae bacterium]|jgi:DNA-binding MarR family transcriptional regulator|nr:MarR family transcriptional regulator [Paracoccaceae bacterium]MCZ8335206.1 MarR family transcriptional regulator [Paracoccaceae bacterium]
MTRSAAQTDAALPADTDLTGYVGYNLKRVLSLVQADLAQVLGTFDLRAVSFSALSIVVRRPGINQTQLAEALKIERSNLVQLIDELSDRALLARTPVAGDRRRYALMPTTAGKTLCARAEAAVAEHEARVFSMLDAGERGTLLALLRKIRTEWPG